MPTLTNFSKSQYVKMILLGHSGSGKTGALASLACAGYKLRILDYDKGLESLVSAIQTQCPDALDNVAFRQLSDKMISSGGKVIPKGVPKAASNGLSMLDKWKFTSDDGEEEDLGKPSEWGRDTFLVVDSLTHLCNSALRYVQVLNSNPGGKVTQPEWGAAQQLIEQMLTLLYSDDFKTNVIITAHIAYIQEGDSKDEKGNDQGEIKGQPMSLGRSLPPKIPSYFNHMLLMTTRGGGAHKKRLLSTVPSGVIDTKSPIIGGKLPKELPIETGLAQYVDVALGKSDV